MPTIAHFKFTKQNKFLDSCQVIFKINETEYYQGNGVYVKERRYLAKFI
jgi:hypothetical protein